MKDRRYRAGVLRGRRSLRDAYTGFAAGLPLVVANIFTSDQREFRPRRGYTRHEGCPYRGLHKQVFVCGVDERSGPGRQAIARQRKHDCSKIPLPATTRF